MAEPKLWPLLIKKERPDLAPMLAALAEADAGDLLIVSVEIAPKGTVQVLVGDA